MASGMVFPDEEPPSEAVPGPLSETPDEDPFPDEEPLVEEPLVDEPTPLDDRPKGSMAALGEGAAPPPAVTTVTRRRLASDVGPAASTVDAGGVVVAEVPHPDAKQGPIGSKMVMSAKDARTQLEPRPPFAITSLLEALSTRPSRTP